MFKLGLYFLGQLQWVLALALYVCTAPLCMISSTLFDWLVSWVSEDQAVALVCILVLEWALSAWMIVEMLINRRGKSIFFYEFVFFGVCANFILIGITYSLLGRDNFLEEFAAKVCTSLLLVLAAERVQIDIKEQHGSCSICMEKMNENYIILKCRHYFHEACLWDWAYVKQECPCCKGAIA